MTTYRPMSEGYKIHPNDPVKSKKGIKPLSTHQRSLIQTFPPDYKFEGNKTDLEQMIGNAVPVNLAYFVATAINKYIASPHQNPSLEIDFDNWELEERLAWCASEPIEDRY